MGRWYDYQYFRPSVPREAKGGIKAQSKRGIFGESWWARRWISVLESFDIGARLGRGRSYARRGQVLSIEIGKGKVNAKVQGSRPKPYDIKIEMKTLSAADWQKLAEALSREVIFTAKLLTSQMPQDIEEVFKQAKLSLFPERLKDLKTDCSCPDWSNPCKHIAAVYYLLGEEFDRDPFLIFKLRGMSREELMGSLSSTGPKAVPKKSKQKLTSSRENEKPPTDIDVTEPSSPEREKRRHARVVVSRSRLSEVETEELPSDVPSFWNGETLPDDFFGEVRIPPMPAVLPKKLGSFPFWRGEQRFLDAMERIYSQASSVGLDIFICEQGHDISPFSSSKE